MNVEKLLLLLFESYFYFSYNFVWFFHLFKDWIDSIHWNLLYTSSCKIILSSTTIAIIKEKKKQADKIDGTCIT